MHWTNLTGNFTGSSQRHLGVPAIYASKIVEGRAYVPFDGHRMNDFIIYVYKTEDYGKTWTKINANLPARRILLCN